MKIYVIEPYDATVPSWRLHNYQETVRATTKNEAATIAMQIFKNYWSDSIRVHNIDKPHKDKVYKRPIPIACVAHPHDI